MNNEFDIDYLIDEILQALYNADKNMLSIQGYLVKKNLAFDHVAEARMIQSSVISKMTRERLIEESTAHVKHISSLGRKIVEDEGGWLEHLKKGRIKNN